MNPLIALVVIVLSVAIAVALMLLVRRYAAPAGGYFTDSDRAAGVFGVTGTGFAVLLAFVIFLSFSSYEGARDKASVEAVAVTQQFRIAKLFSTDDRRRLHGELICYARAVVYDEWRTMRDARRSALVDDWLLRIERTVGGIQIQGDKQRTAYDHWFDEAAERREGRRGRLAAAEPLVPSLVWLTLLLGAALIITYMCFYADRAERAFVQALMMAAVATMVVTGLLVVRFLDHPYVDASGSIKPTQMTMTLHSMEEESRTADGSVARICDQRGRPRAVND